MRLRNRFLSFFIASIGFALPTGAQAQVTPATGAPGPDDTQSVRVGAVIFYDYTFTASPKSRDSVGNVFSPSAFNVARTYINVQGAISHIVSFRITPDIAARESNGASVLNGSYVFRLKYGFAQLSLDDWTGNWKQTWVRLGVQQTPYIDALESVYRYRFQGTTFLERDFGLKSSDAGATFHTNMPNAYGDVHVGLYNGEGYSAAETNSQKSFQVRGTVRPAPLGNAYIKGLRVTGFLVNDSVVANGTRRQYSGNLWYEHRRFNAGFEAMHSTLLSVPSESPLCTGATPPATCGLPVNAHGWSWFATPFFQQKGNGWEMLLRMDDYKQVASPTLGVNTQFHRQRQIIGLAYWFPHLGGSATASLMLDYERVHQINEFAVIQLQPTEQRYTLHGLINF